MKEQKIMKDALTSLLTLLTFPQTPSERNDTVKVERATKIVKQAFIDLNETEMKRASRKKPVRRLLGNPLRKPYTDEGGSV